MFLFSLSNSHNLINKSEDCSTYLIWIGQIRDFWLSIKILVKDVHSCLHNHKKIETFKALANTQNIKQFSITLIKFRFCQKFTIFGNIPPFDAITYLVFIFKFCGLLRIFEQLPSSVILQIEQ
jgi:hypothetical protein